MKSFPERYRKGYPLKQKPYLETYPKYPLVSLFKTSTRDFPVLALNAADISAMGSDGRLARTAMTFAVQLVIRIESDEVKHTCGFIGAESLSGFANLVYIHCRIVSRSNIAL